MATLAEIKVKLGVQSLELNTSKDASGNPTDWMFHFDNERRVSISLHKDLIKEIQANPNVGGLFTQMEERISTTSGVPYTSYRIVKAAAEAELTL